MPRKLLKNTAAMQKPSRPWLALPREVRQLILLECLSGYHPTGAKVAVGNEQTIERMRSPQQEEIDATIESLIAVGHPEFLADVRYVLTKTLSPIATALDKYLSDLHPIHKFIAAVCEISKHEGERDCSLELQVVQSAAVTGLEDLLARDPAHCCFERTSNVSRLAVGVHTMKAYLNGASINETPKHKRTRDFSFYLSMVSAGKHITLVTKLPHWTFLQVAQGVRELEAYITRIEEILGYDEYTAENAWILTYACCGIPWDRTVWPHIERTCGPST